MSNEERMQENVEVLDEKVLGKTDVNIGDNTSVNSQETDSNTEQEDASKISLPVVPKDNLKPTFWKISHGTNVIKDSEEEEFDKRKVAVVNGYTAAKGTNKVTQGYDFMYNMKKGDIFYLCRSNSVRLLCRIETDEVRENPEKLSKNPEEPSGWYERNYAIIAKSKDTSAYKLEHKRWSPQDNSTCIPVPKSEEKLFEEYILKPYFNMTIDDVLTATVEERNYWFLNANPNEWELNKLPVGDTVDYNFCDEDGHARRVAQNFKNAKIGDMVIGYVTGTDGGIFAKLIISEKKEGESITFKKLEQLSSPVTYETLNACDELKNMQRLEGTYKSYGGSLFILTKNEYECIVKLIKEANPEENIAPQKDPVTVSYKNSYSYDLKKSRNIIFHGAPGTGKTYLAKQIAIDIISNGAIQEYKDLSAEQKEQIEFVQFHPSYDYTDFVEGLRPKLNNDGSMGFELQDGIFKRFCARAEENSSDLSEDGKKYIFIIDEINRGEISKIFGELFFSIDPGYRGHAGEVSTQYANLHSTLDGKFYVPENVYIIGTMNDIDRSVDTFDFAMRRRFRFIELKAKECQGMLNQLRNMKNEAIARMNRLNDAIVKIDGLNDNYQIGPAYFLKLNEIKSFDLLWSDYLQPLLCEYIHGMAEESDSMKTLEKAYNNTTSEEAENGDNTEA